MTQPSTPRPIPPPPSDRELSALDQQRADELRQAENGWKVWSSLGSANPFHHYRPERTGHEVWVRTLTRPALVLGSTQSPALLTSEAHIGDYEISRRRSGGGLVLLDSTRDVWIDVLIPADSPLWDSDVGRSFNWLGDTWARVLHKHLPAETITVHHTSAPPQGRVLCFAAMGHGEVSVGGRKVVGLSQRRTRNWARLQCAVVQHWPAPLLATLITTGPDIPDPTTVAAGLPPGVAAVPPDKLVEAFLADLTNTPVG